MFRMFRNRNEHARPGMNLLEAQRLAEQLEKFTISSLRNDEVIGFQKDGKNILEFPPEVLTKIFTYVGKNASNPPPTDEFMDYLTARSTGNFKNKTGENPIRGEKGEWLAKVKKEYAVRNLMMLRGVCSQFENVINLMVPGTDYDFLMIDVRIKNCQETTSAVEIFKYGGDGSQYPCTRLRRVRRYNELEYEHIQRCERIRNLYITDMVLTEELFETILRLDLTKAENITFERVLDVNFHEYINVVNYIQNFLNTLDSSANVFFNSEVFDPNVILFGLKPNDVPGMIAGREVFQEAFEFETQWKHHKARRASNCRISSEDERFRRLRTKTLVKTMLTSKQPNTVENIGNKSKPFKTLMLNEYNNLTRNKGKDLKKAGKYHMNKVFQILKDQPIKRRKLLFHLKTLKRIVGDCPVISADEEQAIVRQWEDSKHREKVVRGVPFLQKVQLMSGTYSKYFVLPSFENLSLGK